MNVFILDHDMDKSAQMLDDAHLKSQINEACQILMANWNHEHYPDAKIGHLNHPVTEYYRNDAPKEELIHYLYYLIDEYLHRFGKDHQNYFWLKGFYTDDSSPLYHFTFSKTYVDRCMTCDIESIRNYIMTKPMNKKPTWTNREKPEWWVV